MKKKQSHLLAVLNALIDLEKKQPQTLPDSVV